MSTGLMDPFAGWVPEPFTEEKRKLIKADLIAPVQRALDRWWFTKYAAEMSNRPAPRNSADPNEFPAKDRWPYKRDPV